MIDFSKGAALGFVWIDVRRRPIYSAREIQRGKNKGKLEVEYRHSASRYKKKIVDKSEVRWFKDDIEEPQDEFTYDHPCPKCGKWLFHSIYGCY